MVPTKGRWRPRIEVISHNLGERTEKIRKTNTKE